MDCAVTHNAFLSYLFLPASNCGFMRHIRSASGFKSSADRGNTINRYKRNIHHGQIHLLRDLFACYIAEVRPLKVYDFFIVAQLPRELTVTDVDRVHLGRSVLKQHIREATGRSAAVDADLSRRIDRKDLQGLVA